MNNNISPLSIAEQIEVLEAAKVLLVSPPVGPSYIGLCSTISHVIKVKHNNLHSLVVSLGVCAVIPSFTFENAVLSGTVSADAVPYWFWWDPVVAKGGITNRLNFLDFLIDNLKNEVHE